MQCQFETRRPVHIAGTVVEGRFEAEYSEVVEALVANGLIEPVFAPVEPVETPVWWP